MITRSAPERCRQGDHRSYHSVITGASAAGTEAMAVMPLALGQVVYRPRSAHNVRSEVESWLTEMEESMEGGAIELPEDVKRQLEQLVNPPRVFRGN